MITLFTEAHGDAVVGVINVTKVHQLEVSSLLLWLNTHISSFIKNSCRSASSNTNTIAHTDTNNMVVNQVL